VSRTFTTVGIVLKAMPMGETDRLVTFLAPEQGILRAIAPGARKPKSPLSGRMGLFVVNELLMAPGRSLAKVLQAEAIATFSKLSQDLAKLITAQYWAELVLAQALEDHPQPELFTALTTYLQWLELAPSNQVLPGLVIGIYHFLHLAGLTPQLDYCGLSQEPIDPNTALAHGGVYFSTTLGGIVSGNALQEMGLGSHSGSGLSRSGLPRPVLNVRGATDRAAPPWPRSAPTSAPPRRTLSPRERSFPLSPEELSYLQQLPHLALSLTTDPPPGLLENNGAPWLALERLFREYAQYHLEHPIRSATLIEGVFA
jgi:DNA repair protein RecO (recombination protein O)